MFETTSKNPVFSAANSRAQPTTITLQVNGETYDCPSPINLPELLTHLGLNPRLIAVEYNGEILHRQNWTDTQLQNGDRLEIVTIVGGG
jgi:sulfur carrier protein